MQNNKLNVIADYIVKNPEMIEDRSEFLILLRDRYDEDYRKFKEHPNGKKRIDGKLYSYADYCAVFRNIIIRLGGDVLDLEKRVNDEFRQIELMAQELEKPRDITDRLLQDTFQAYKVSMGKYPVLEQEEMIKLFKRYHKRNKTEKSKAKKTLIEHNLRLVISVALKYQRFGLPLTDLVGEGNLGLIRAIEKYDYQKINPKTNNSYHFSTYALWWIRQAIMRALSNSARIIRIPVHTDDKTRRMNKTELNFFFAYKRSPTNEELSLLMNEPVKNILHYKELRGRRMVSFDKPVNNETDGAVLGDFMRDEKADGYADKITKKNYAMKILLLAELSPKQRKVIEYRYGLKGGGEHTLEEIGNMMNLTRERVRQIENKALIKLKAVADRKDETRLAIEVLLRRKAEKDERIKREYQEYLDRVKQDRLGLLE